MSTGGGGGGPLGLRATAAKLGSMGAHRSAGGQRARQGQKSGPPLAAPIKRVWAV